VKGVLEVEEIGVGDILYFEPLKADGAGPFAILFPKVTVLLPVFHSALHFSDAAEMF
jgi:hypothetical protein